MNGCNYSLIIPHYNIPNLLRRLLSTIPQRDDLQIIVVDDCSSEECVKELEKIKNEFPKAQFYSTDINGGGGKARNVGLQHANGKYLIFADADDYFNLCFNDCLDQYKDTDFDIIYFAVNSVDTLTYHNCDRGAFILPQLSKFLTNKKAQNVKFKFTAPWAKFISKKMVFDNNIKFQESIVYNDMRFSQLCDFYAQNINADLHAIYCITYRINSISCIDNPQKELEKVKVMIEYYNFFRENGIPYSIKNLLAPTYFDLIKMRHYDYAKESLALWRASGISKFTILKALCDFLIIKVILYLK